MKSLTYCPHGHEFTLENTYINPKGSKVCRTCKRIRGKEEARSRNNIQNRYCLQCDTLIGITLAKYCSDCVRPHPGAENLLDGNRVRKYGVDRFMFEAMYFEQNGSCLLCDNEATDIDHDHVTGRVRGLLCSICNKRLGQIENNPDWLIKAHEYLKEGKY